MGIEENVKSEISQLLSKNNLVKASRLCHKYKIDIKEFPELSKTIKHLYENGQYQKLLFAYKESGYKELHLLGGYTPKDLLKKLANKGNDATVIKYSKLCKDQEIKNVIMKSLTNRVEYLIKKGALVKAVRACRKNNIHPDSFQSIIDLAKTYYLKKQYQIILGAIYEGGVFGNYTVDELLKKLSSTNMQSAFLVNAFRFGFYNKFQIEIKKAIKWHRDRGLKDADAWEKKFANMEELPTTITQIKAHSTIATIRLHPVNLTTKKNLKKSVEIDQIISNDPYIVSQTSRVKVEKATKEHKQTLRVLQSILADNGFSLSNSKLIDLMGKRKNKLFIFEVKSINANNERDQVRHAVSQLFEYRYLHKLPDAKLFIVFSCEPFSGWLVDYLRYIGILVIWVNVNDESLEGPDEDQLINEDLIQ